MAVNKLSKCLDNSGLPTDVQFVFKGEYNLPKKVKAHKLILSIASDVFEREFYGSMKEDGDKITIEDAEQEVF